MAKAKQEHTLRKQKAKSRIPTFKTIEEEAAFWDTHSTTEFEDEFEEVTEDIRFVVSRRQPKKAITVRLEEDTLAALIQQAQELGIGPSTLARMWIREHLKKSEAPPSSPQSP